MYTALLNTCQVIILYLQSVQRIYQNVNLMKQSHSLGNSPKTLNQFYTQSDTDMQKELINNYVNIWRTIS